MIVHHILQFYPNRREQKRSSKIWTESPKFSSLEQAWLRASSHLWDRRSQFHIFLRSQVSSKENVQNKKENKLYKQKVNIWYLVISFLFLGHLPVQAAIRPSEKIKNPLKGNTIFYLMFIVSRHQISWTAVGFEKSTQNWISGVPREHWGDRGRCSKSNWNCGPGMILLLSLPSSPSSSFS